MALECSVFGSAPTILPPEHPVPGIRRDGVALRDVGAEDHQVPRTRPGLLGALAQPPRTARGPGEDPTVGPARPVDAAAGALVEAADADQALHQDNFYLRVEPGTCVAAWIACDVIDRENGGLEVVPGTHRMDVFCPEQADEGLSFAREYVPPPPGLAAVPVDMEPGDVLFFNGSLVHGSQPNRSADRFRRSYIGHYVGRSTQRIGSFYRTLSMSGDPVPMRESAGAGPCGTEFAATGPH